MGFRLPFPPFPYHICGPAKHRGAPECGCCPEPAATEGLWEHLGQMGEGLQGGFPALSLGFETAVRPLLALGCDEPREELSQAAGARRTLCLSAVRGGRGVCVASEHVDRHAVDKQRCEVCLKGSLNKSQRLVCKHRKLSRKCPFRKAIFFYLKKRLLQIYCGSTAWRREVLPLLRCDAHAASCECRESTGMIPRPCLTESPPHQSGPSLASDASELLGFPLQPPSTCDGV